MPDVLAAQIWGLPRWAFSPVFGTANLEMELAVSFGSFAAACIAWLAWWMGRTLDKRCRKAGLDWRIGQPGRSLCAVAAVTGLQVFVEQVVLFREQPGVVAAAGDHGRPLRPASLAGGRPDQRHRERLSYVGSRLARPSLDAALILLCFRILSLIGALFVIFHAASELGLSIAPIIAGLGVGGLAVALAIILMLENIVGGFCALRRQTGQGWRVLQLWR